MLRRNFVRGVAFTGGMGSMGSIAVADTLAMPSELCRPTLRQTLGPYLTPNSPKRSNIREERPGVPLQLSLNVIDDYFCKPVEGATVEIWHCDATGLYSGVENTEFDLTTLLDTGKSVDTRGKSFLRGQQTTGADGHVQFTTIIPGWYTGRLAHIHLQTIFKDLAWTSHVTQLYLPQDIERRVYETDAYRARGQNPIGVDRDYVVRGDEASVRQLTIPLAKQSNGYRGEFTLAVSL